MTVRRTRTVWFSLGACLVETAARLVAEQGQDEVAHQVGMALKGAEVLGMRRLDRDEWRTGRQGLEVTLGFYQRADRRYVEENEPVAANEFARSLGGYEWAVQLRCVDLDPDAWLPAQYRRARSRLDRHLHREVLALRAREPGRSARRSGPAARARLASNELLIIARRLRYRVSVDHAQAPDEAKPHVICWTTPTTEAWIARTEQNLGRLVTDVVRATTGRDVSSDDARNNPDDWGCVQLTGDPLRVVLIGPRSETAPSREDVDRTLTRAGGQLQLAHHPLATYETRHPLQDYAAALLTLAEAPDLLDLADVVLVYRGGGLRDEPAGARADPDARGLVRAEDRVALYSAAHRLVARGVEVVIGIGHGDLSALPPGADLPIGLFEAVTPTAAALWVLREHVNNRLVDARPDPGQERGA